MKRKRLIAVLLTAAMVLGMTAGCGKSGNQRAEQMRMVKR